MIKVYQINLSDSDIDTVNAKGFQAVPKANARCKMQFGAKEWEPEFVDFYSHVANVKTDDLNQTFESTNLWEDDLVEKVEPMYSTSVGDIFVKGDVAYIVDRFGFAEIPNPFEV